MFVKFGHAAIVLVPEISLTPQTRGRFEGRFRIGRRAAQSDDVLRNVIFSGNAFAAAKCKWSSVRGMPCSLRCPDLGLIVLDEEHDGSFKQDTQPRYHARKVAYARADPYRFRCFWDRPRPPWNPGTRPDRSRRIDSIAASGRTIDPMPDVQLVDLRLKDERASGSISQPLQQAMTKRSLRKGKQSCCSTVGVFRPRFSAPHADTWLVVPIVICRLTHHRDGGKAVCHYCDYQIATPPWCPECRFDGIRYGGLGTQRLEVEVKARFPEARVARMDSDTMRKAGSHQKVLSAFRKGEVDVLLGTQMIAKGLDFPNVLVGRSDQCRLGPALPRFSRR